MLDFKYFVGILSLNVCTKRNHSVALNRVPSNWEGTDIHLLNLKEGTRLLIEFSLQLILIVHVNFKSLVKLLFGFRGRFYTRITELI